MDRRALTLAAVVAPLLAVGLLTPAGGAGIVPPRNPASDLAPVPDYTVDAGVEYIVGGALPPCWTWDGSSLALDGRASACTSAEVAATDHAHALEHLAPIALPRNWARLSVAEQLLVTVDIERVSRGEAPVLGLLAALDGPAQAGAARNADPVLTVPVAGSTGAYASNWAEAVNALDANYGWMYQDGWAGADTTNEACTAPGAAGCWGHRDNILDDAARQPCYQAPCSLVMGAGYVPGRDDGYGSFTELLVQVSGTPPALYYTWRAALAAGARP